MENNRYNIVTNKNGRRILVVNRLVEIDKEESISEDSFDAVYINIAHRAYEENRLIVRWLSPIRTHKNYMKPLFATTSLEEYMDFVAFLIDGFCSTPFDDKFADFIEMVYENFNKFNIVRELNTKVNSSAKNFANMIKFDMSRGRTTFTNMAIRGYAKGYSAVFLEWYDYRETLLHEERLKFNVKLTELGFAEKVKLLDRVHTCPECGDSHLLFVECCPKCDSSNIHQESVIHHFRCANISPESTYEWDGQLRCPKCKKMLRHIGVDYDRPASVYNCQDCGNSFMTSKMRVVCTNCGTHTTPDKLIPVDINEYRLTREGLEAFASDTALLQIESKDIFSGYCTFDEFKNTILSFAKMSSYKDQLLLILRYEYIYNGDAENWRLLDIMRAILSKVVTFKVTSRDNEFLLLSIINKANAEKEILHIHELVDQLFQEYTTRDNHFSARLLKRYVFDGEQDNSEDLVRSLTEKVDISLNNDDF